MSVLQFETGYRLEIATVRKLEAENDAFVFGDKLIEKWYQNVEQGNKKGILLLVTSAKEGALTGGPAFLKVVTLEGNAKLQTLLQQDTAEPSSYNCM